MPDRRQRRRHKPPADRLGITAAENGRSVHYTTAALPNELAEAADDRQLTRIIARYSVPMCSADLCRAGNFARCRSGAVGADCLVNF